MCVPRLLILGYKNSNSDLVGNDIIVWVYCKIIGIRLSESTNNGTMTHFSVKF